MGEPDEVPHDEVPPRSSAGGELDAAIGRSVVEAVAGDHDVPVDDLETALVVLDADLKGRHSTYEREYDYATVEGVRVYAVDPAAWDELRGDLDLAAEVGRAAEAAHTRQAADLVDRGGADLDFESASGVVAVVETAEDME